MATRARELLDRSRSLFGRSRTAAAQFLGTQRPDPAPRPAPTPPRALEPPRPVEMTSEDALIAICSSVALRDLNLVDSLLAQLEEMEAKEEDQDRLAELYRLDHLATRLRRNAENLRVLAGRDASDTASDTASLVDVVRAAMSSIDHYARVTIGRVVSLGVVGFAAEDLSRLLAELLDNATGQSPPNSAVRVSAHLTEQGSVLVRIEDEGIGLPGERLADLNARLDAAPVLDHDSVQHMGLAVVRRLAGRHGMRARLERRMPHGTTATVLLPAELVCELPEASWSGTQTVVFPQTNGSTRPAPEPQPVAAARPSRNSLAALPRRSEAATHSAPPLARRKPSPTPTTDGVTRGGLPRRVSRSIKGSADQAEGSAAPDPAPETDVQAGHDQLIADLGAFADGERAARGENTSTDTKPAKETEQ
ncbi:ATP-binding protein [Amycolatopsis anabasis]|uniref:ATP-binding protein n=1 Tax=Amycolatopsis anabasis TaxID=1840409 RepID=UPI00131D5B8F|nr:ATP-binding protein [Amycolatopsis anabasis]